jgi:hypothetical protein
MLLLLEHIVLLHNRISVVLVTRTRTTRTVYDFLDLSEFFFLLQPFVHVIRHTNSLLPSVLQNEYLRVRRTCDEP